MVIDLTYKDLEFGYFKPMDKVEDASEKLGEEEEVDLSPPPP
jgi:hypothetical protein